MKESNPAKKPKSRKQSTSKMSLRECAQLTLKQYFEDLGEEVPSNLYQFVIREVEGPMLSVVMKHTNDNQSQAAAILGLNRGTLRKKLKEYQLIP